jgi:hypothetical protein
MEAPLIEAIFQGDSHEVDELLNMNANVDELVHDDNMNYEHDTTALMVAIGMRQSTIARLLLKKGADVNAQNAGGWTAVMIATTTGQVGLTKYLVHKGADLNLRTNDGHAAVFYACLNGDTSLIRYLSKKTSRAVLQGTLLTLLQIQDAPREIILLLENIVNKKAVGGSRRSTRRRRILSGGTRKREVIVNEYYSRRKEFHYYKKVKEILDSLTFSSIIDVGCRKSPMMAGLDNTIYKAMLDIQEIPPMDGIHMIQADFYTWTPDRKYDVVLCLQVLEHLDKPKEFAQKLLQVGKTVIISVPYKWKEGSCKYHTQDPIDKSKLKGWVGREPDEDYVVTDKGLERIICVYR